MLLALLAAVVAPQLSAPFPVTTLEATSTPAAEQGTAAETVRLRPLQDDRMTVAVSLGDHGPYHFLVDTGADRTAISMQLAERLRLPAGKGVAMHSVTGRNLVRTASVSGLRIADRSVSVVDAPLLDAAHVDADGILGTDVLRSAQIRFDFRANLLSIAPAGRASRAAREPDTIVVEARRRAGRLIVTQAEIEGLRVTIVIDTGSDLSVGNSALRAALGRRGLLSADRSINLISVTGDKLRADYAMLRRMTIGGLGLDNLGVAFANAHTFKVMGLDRRPALLLGMNALRAFDSVTIDLATRTIRFRLPEEGSRGELASSRLPGRHGG